MVWLALRSQSTSLNSHNRNIQKAQIQLCCDSLWLFSGVESGKSRTNKDPGVSGSSSSWSGNLAQWSSGAVMCRDSLAQTPRHIPVQLKSQTQQINSCPEGSERRLQARGRETQHYSEWGKKWRNKLAQSDLWCFLKWNSYSLRLNFLNIVNQKSFTSVLFIH